MDGARLDVDHRRLYSGSILPREEDRQGWERHHAVGRVRTRVLVVSEVG